MIRIIYILMTICLMSCSYGPDMEIVENDVVKIEVYAGGNRELLNMKPGFEKDMIKDLNNSSNSGPTKFMKSHRILIYHSNGKVDTVYSNGKAHMFKGYYVSDENLIEKYSISEKK